MQASGIGYDETYASVTRMATVRILFTIAATAALRIRQIDVVGAYLNAPLTEEIYLAPLERMHLVKAHTDLFRLKGALYPVGTQAVGPRVVG